MKKLVVIFVLAFVAFVSCKQFDFGKSQENGEYGTVVFDLTGNSNLRAIDPRTGLPDLASSKMKIIVKVEGQEKQVVEFGEEAKRQYKGTFLVGSKVKFTVIVMTKSGKWKGSSEITVASGTNNLSVKLKKAIAELEPLKFKLYMDETISSNPVKRFSLGFFDDEHPFFREGGKDIEVSIDEYKKKIPSFCRDSKGRTYIFYKNNATGGDSKIILKRYTSEGDEDSSFSYSDDASDRTNILVTADNKTGNVFVSYRGGIPPQTKLYLVKQEENNVTLKDITPIGEIKDVSTMSVYNNVISTVESDSTTNKIKIYSYSNENTPVSKLKDKEIGVEKGGLLDINVEGTTRVINGEVVDSFMNDKHIYFLYNYNKADIYSISTGGILKCGYSYTSGVGSINEVKRLIAKTGYIADEHNIINVKEEDGAKEFYGPQRFVGFNEDVLYIADDGMVREYEAGQTQLLENKNRLVSFNLKSEDIRVKKENLETWLPENKVIAKTKPTLFFSYEKVSQDTFAKIKLHDESGFLHFENNTDDVLSIGRPHTDGLRYIVDSSGNFYVLHEDYSGPNKLEKYSPHKTESGVVYKRDYIFEGINLAGADYTNKITRLYYDHVKKDLYYCIDSGELYRLDGDNWGNINRGNYSLKEIMTIYDGRIWAYKKDAGKIESIGIEGGALEISPKPKFDIPRELATKKVLSLSMYNDVLYLLYSDAGTTFRQDVYALAVKKDGSNLQKTNEPLFKLATYIEDIRPIGFDEKTQELKFFRDVVNKDYDGRVSENINGYVAIKYDGNSLAKKEIEAPSDDIKWYAEEKAWQGATNAIMLWNQVSSNKKAKFYARTKGELADDITSSTRPSLASSSSSTPYEVYDKFCYDQFGNLYVLIKRRNKYYVVRAKLTEDNEYNLRALATVLDDDVRFDSSNDAFEVTYSGLSDTTLDKFIMAVYADTATSGTLYYSYIDGHFNIKKHDFTNDSFKRGSPELFLSNIPTDDGTNLETRLMAIAANKDGVFIAQKELEYTKPNNMKYYKSYNIEVRKYLHNSTTTYDPPNAAIDIVGSKTSRVPTEMFSDYSYSNDPSNPAPNLKDKVAQWDKYIRENITDMYAYNGLLYALSYKRVGGESFQTEEDNPSPKLRKATVSGAMWKVCNTDEALNSAKKVFEIKDEDEKEKAGFSPRRFIAVLPKKLVVASDGYYGFIANETPSGAVKKAINYDKVFFFNLKGDEVEEESDPVDVKATFDFNLEEETSVNVGLDCEWVWNN